MGYTRFQIGCVFVEYDLLNTTTFTQNFIYIDFRIIFTQFYINFSRQEHQKDVLYVSFNAWDFQVSSYIPFHFSFTVFLTFQITLTFQGLKTPKIAEWSDSVHIKEGSAISKRLLKKRRVKRITPLSQAF